MLPASRWPRRYVGCGGRAARGESSPTPAARRREEAVPRAALVAHVESPPPAEKAHGVRVEAAEPRNLASPRRAPAPAQGPGRDGLGEPAPGDVARAAANSARIDGASVRLGEGGSGEPGLYKDLKYS